MRSGKTWRRSEHRTAGGRFIDRNESSVRSDTMVHMLCRVRVKDFDQWFEAFRSHRAAHEEAGMTLLRVSREQSDPNNVFFSFDVADMDRARGFIEAPEAAEAGQDSGVLEGEYHFVDVTEGYSTD